MDNQYLFIIWEKSMFKRKDILNDLSKFFVIKKNLLVKWNKNNFDDNLKAFYGRKITYIKEKKHFIGTNVFNVVIVEDLSPKLDYRMTGDVEVLVNTNIFDKKELYRKWTAECFRIHNSTTLEETKHDLTVLFGKDIDKYNDNKIINVDTKGIEGFVSLDDFKDCLKCFGDNYLYVNDDNIIIFAKYRIDIERFLNNYPNSINIANKNYHLNIFGEEEGDLPVGFINSINDNLINDFLDIKEEYINYLNDRKLNITIKEFFDKYNFDSNFNEKDTLRTSPSLSLIQILKKDIKYLLIRIKG